MECWRPRDDLQLFVRDYPPGVALESPAAGTEHRTRTSQRRCPAGWSTWRATGRDDSRTLPGRKGLLGDCRFNSIEISETRWEDKDLYIFQQWRLAAGSTTLITPASHKPSAIGQQAIKPLSPQIQAYPPPFTGHGSGGRAGCVV